MKDSKDNKIYPLGNHEVFESNENEGIIDYLIVTQDNISKSKLQEYLEDYSFSTLIQQYNFYKHCHSISQNLIDIAFSTYVSQFKYKWYDDSMRIGNYFVPHFYIHPFIDSHTRQLVEHLENPSLSIDSEMELVLSVLDTLPFDKENIHIGFLTDGNRKAKFNFIKFNHLLKALEKGGYDINHNFVFRHSNYNELDGIVDDDFNLENFSWDDSYSSIVTVLIDFISDKKRRKKIIDDYITFDGSFDDFNYAGRILYFSIFYKDLDRNYYLTSPRNICYIDLATLQREWKAIPQRPFFLFPAWIYYPKSSQVRVDLTDIQIREKIWRFKDGIDSLSKADDIQLLDEILERIKNIISHTFNDHDESRLTFACVPSSSSSDYLKRYSYFSQRVCDNSEMTNSINEITYISEGTPKHLGGTGLPNIRINPNFFKDKFVIVFDDIYTTGKTMSAFCNKLSECGAIVVGGIVLGITQRDKQYENELGTKGLYDFFRNNIW